MLLAEASWHALGTTAVLRVTDRRELARATTLLEDQLGTIDRACSRFRVDSELAVVNANAGRFVAVSPLLFEAIALAVRSAALTGGAVDPTLGGPIALAGYSRDWSTLTTPCVAGEVAETPIAPRPALTARRAPGWRSVEFRCEPPAVRIPAGVRLDLGATAKAFAADRAARALAAATGAGVLVSLGGDIAVAGEPPREGWAIRVTDDHRATPDAPGETITIASGGVATSSTTVRRWTHDERLMHHILDPETGAPTAGPWRTVSVAAASCLDANTAATAAIVRGPSAVQWLEDVRLPARLVTSSGIVRRVAGWPDAPTERCGGPAS